MRAASNATNEQELPLHVYQVLEEEYISLHGPLDDDERVRLPDHRNQTQYRVVRARRDWRFHRGHVKHPTGLVLQLLSGGGSRPADALAGRPVATRERSKKELAIATRAPLQRPLTTYLRAKISQDILDRVLRDVTPFEPDLNVLFDAGPPTTPDVERGRAALTDLERELNAVLSSADLYTEERFKDVTLDAGLSALTETRLALDGANLEHFNRVLLEHAFRDELEPIGNVRLAAIHQRFHRLENHSALCLSGGGIRSATFALGLLQGLARRNFLEQFDYLSTVSGGGYIGGWLSAWLHRDPEGIRGVTRSLANCPPSIRIDPDAEPVLHLRTYSNFITPKTGLLSADTWAFVAIYLRNLVLNWAVLIPLLLGCLLLPRLYVSIILAAPVADAPLFRGLMLRHSFLALGALLSIAAVTYTAFSRPHAREQLRTRSPFWFKRTNQRSFLRYCLLPLTAGAICLALYWAWSLEARQHEGVKSWIAYAGFGGAVTLSGWMLGAIILRRYRRSHWREISWTEASVLTLAGVVGGLLFWGTETLLKTIDKSPVVAAVDRAWTTWATEFYTVIAVPVYLAGFLLAMTLFVGLTSHSKRFTDEDREWWARANAWILILILGWLVFATLVIFGPLALIHAPKISAAFGTISGVVALVAGRSAKTAANDEQAAQRGRFAALLARSLPALALIFLSAFFMLLSLLTSAVIVGGGTMVVGVDASDLRWPALRYLFTAAPADAPVVTFNRGQLALLHIWAVHYPSVLLVSALLILAAGFGLGMARAVNLNRFSLHAGYRDRLIRAFLGASRRRGERQPNPFTGFDPADNVQMHELRPVLFHEGDFAQLGRLAVRLRQKQDRVSRYLWDENRITEKTKHEIEAYSPDARPSQSLKVALIEDLNRALEDQQKPLYREPVFQPLLARDEDATKMLAWLERHPQSDYRLLLNRRLLQRAYGEEIRKKYPPPHRLLHVVNTALNLVGGDNLAWQQRRAEPFSISPLHCGCFRLGYRRAKDYGGEDGISIGTAVAISGAAASSNMGYYTTSPLISMLLTLFNVRLGWWLGNPGPAGERTYGRQSPKFSVGPILDEAFGLTDDRNKYVYLSDGGHFENLALYEMVLRRCKIIVVSDGGADENYEFTDLGNAIRKIRIDLGIPIEFGDLPIWRGKLERAAAEQDSKADGLQWALGQIQYSGVDSGAEDGVLIYVKPAVYGSEPRDVLHYKQSHETFPHETTADQFFDEPQFESYRSLGSHAMDRIFRAAGNPNDLQGLAAGLYAQRGAATPWRWPEFKAEWLTRERQRVEQTAGAQARTRRRWLQILADVLVRT